MESALRCITHHLRVAAAEELVPHMAEDLPGRPVARQLPFLDMIWVNPFSASVLTYAACRCCQPMSSTAWAASPRATPTCPPPMSPCASTTRVFGHLPDDQRSSGVCWAGACALPNVSAAPFTILAMANELVFAGARIAWNGGQRACPAFRPRGMVWLGLERGCRGPFAGARSHPRNTGRVH